MFFTFICSNICCTVGICLALLGTILLYYAQILALGGAQALDWQYLAANGGAMNPALAKVAFCFLFVGYGTKVGLATVYRNLQAMAADGEIDVLRTDDGESVYRACSTGHHHHLVCRECGRTVEIDGPAVERWAATVSAAHGFTEVTHSVEIFGRCRDCS